MRLYEETLSLSNDFVVYGIDTYCKFLHPLNIPIDNCEPLNIANSSNDLIFVLFWKIVPMEPSPKRPSYLLVNRCVFHR